MEDQIAQNAVYPLSDKLMASWRVPLGTGMIFRLAEMHLSNAEFQLGRYHAAVAETVTKRNILAELSNEYARLMAEPLAALHTLRLTERKICRTLLIMLKNS